MTKLLHSTAHFPECERESVVTIGVFDGVHLGHQQIITECVEESRRRGIASVLLTFDMNPRKVVSDDRPCLITDRDRKLSLVRALGADYAIEIKFTPQFASLTPEEFCRDVLSKQLGAKQVCVGANFRFGKGKAGDVRTLAEWGSSLGYEVDVIPLVEVGGSTVSSTLIRRLLREGRVEEAGSALGRKYSVRGRVIRGHARGKSLGFPTANLGLERRFCIPADGVYAGKVHVDRLGHVCAVNIGSNPTFGDEELSIEVYILDFTCEIYGETLEVEFHYRLRDEIAFVSEEDLTLQMERDVERARELLGAG